MIFILIAIVEVSKMSDSMGSMGVVVGAPGSPMTRSASRHQDKATSWSSAPDTRPTIQLAQTTNSPSPPQTTQSVSSTYLQRLLKFSKNNLY